MEFLKYWGKASRPGEEKGYHLLAFHSLDVAACAQAHLSRDPHLLTRLEDCCSRSGLALTGDELLSTVTLLVATHDLGKFSGRFQMLRPDIVADLGLELRRYPYGRRHDAIGAGFWRDRVLPHLLDGGGLSARTLDGDLEEIDCHDLLMPWLNAVTGHHGQPPAPLDGRGETDSLMAPEQSTAALQFVDEAIALFGSLDFRFDREIESLDRALAGSSWLMAGIAVAADWIGSNRNWFPYETAEVPLAEYWREIALPRAARAIERAGLLPARPTAFPGYGSVFDGIHEPSPLQRSVAEVPLDAGPQLFLIEDQTGAGKTEAALALASRLMGQGEGDGLFLALPTMATANAMHARLSEVYPRLFQEGQAVTYTLAHGDARNVLGMERAPLAPDYSAGEADLSTELHDWIGDSNKKALLAQVGIGTVDQALLCGLRAKHSVLRLLGLHRHVLMVDEVHACDSYVTKVLETVLEFQAMLGGSAILLSATLPARMRNQLVGAFRKGLKDSGPLGAASEEYPLLTVVSSSGTRALACGARKELERRLPVRFVHEESGARAYVLSRASKGECVVWIRNTVRDALRAYDDLVGEMGADRVELFHARFLLGDRLRIEKEVVGRFGKTSSEADRAGRVLIATQVVEQSLDIDFDAMVTDLAPIDLVIQRSGRLHRHNRSGRAAPELVVLAPPWDENPGAGHFATVLSGTVHVYDDLAALWRTQRALRSAGEIHVPGASRVLVESVYAEDGTVPEGLQKSAIRAENKSAGDRGTASFFAHEPSRGYLHDVGWAADDMGAPTRLGEPTTRLRFGIVNDGSYRPCFPEWKGNWSLSSCRIPVRQVSEASNAEYAGLVIESTMLMPDRGRGCVNFAVTAEGDSRWSAEGMRPDQKRVRIEYDRKRGLAIRGSTALRGDA